MAPSLIIGMLLYRLIQLMMGKQFDSQLIIVSSRMAPEKECAMMGNIPNRRVSISVFARSSDPKNSVVTPLTQRGQIQEGTINPSQRQSYSTKHTYSHLESVYQPIHLFIIYSSIHSFVNPSILFIDLKTHRFIHLLSSVLPENSLITQTDYRSYNPNPITV